MSSNQSEDFLTALKKLADVTMAKPSLAEGKGKDVQHDLRFYIMARKVLEQIHLGALDYDAKKFDKVLAKGIKSVLQETKRELEEKPPLPEKLLSVKYNPLRTKDINTLLAYPDSVKGWDDAPELEQVDRDMRDFIIKHRQQLLLLKQTITKLNPDERGWSEEPDENVSPKELDKQTKLPIPGTQVDAPTGKLSQHYRAAERSADRSR